MSKTVIEELKRGLETAFIEQNIHSNLIYKPQLIFNNYKEGRKVLSSIEDELLVCDNFFISVAFVTEKGIKPLLQTLKELELRGVQGRILTTDYLYFNEPKALKTLNELNNIELRMYCSDKSREGFHIKGYVFKKENLYQIIVGSSNLTISALTKNQEWNTKLVSTEQGEYARQIIEEFDKLWDSKFSEPYEQFIDCYTEKYERKQNAIKKQKEFLKTEENQFLQRYSLKPNEMQTEFIANLKRLEMQGEERALLISATGTGKTYASAFAARDKAPSKLLFLVHREQIARKAMKSFEDIFDKSKSFGLLSGSSKEYDSDFLFSTMQMMSKKEIFQRFARDEFEMIIIDEVHHAGAESYQRIMDYFEPKFWLGMTASPERMDGIDIYRMFHHNIACEIRLQQALEEDLLCPFHYFGISELEIDGQVFNDDSALKRFSDLVCEERVNYILEKALYYGYSGERVKGLVFCSGKEEAIELSNQFNLKGFHSAFLCGEDSQEKRERCIEQLTSDSEEDYLEYIFTIDIFNEGVDIPEINQVIMLRPTQSPIVFVQQLGRGLRKAEGKEFVIVLDFIGNYTNNFMIPVALSGDRSYRKDNMRKFIFEGNRMLPGCSSIHFDEISRRRILASIDEAKTNSIKLIKESYFSLKYKLGRIPMLNDFSEHGEIDVTKIFEKCGSYYEFLVKYDKDYEIRLTEEEKNMIEYLSKTIAKGKRIHELVMLEQVKQTRIRLIEFFKLVMKNKYHIEVTAKEEESVIRNLTNQFMKDVEKEKYEECVILEEDMDGEYQISKHFSELLENVEFEKIVFELVDFGISRYKERYSERYKDTNFQLYEKYSYEDVCRLLNWKKSKNAQIISGYFYDSDTKTMPVFINYDKADDAIAYEDRFVSSSEFIALSKHPRKVDSNDVNHIYKKGEADSENKIYLFVRKNKKDNETKEFYFLGEINAIGEPVPIQMESTKDDAFEITYHLETPVREDIYNYIKGDER